MVHSLTYCEIGTAQPRNTSDALPQLKQVALNWGHPTAGMAAKVYLLLGRMPLN